MIARAAVAALLLVGLAACGASDSDPGVTPNPSPTASDFCSAWSDLPAGSSPVSGVETPGTPPDSAALYAPLVDLAPPEISADVRALASTADPGSPESMKKFAAANARVSAWVEQNC